MLKPKIAGLVGKNKPSVLILNSPHDQISCAVRYSSVAMLAEERGYRLLNKRPISFFDVNAEMSIKPNQQKNKELTIWVEAHGAPGWLFAGPKTANAEMVASIDFANYLKDIEASTGLTVTNVMLNCCFSANEYINDEGTIYFNSPARILSILMPNCNVMGFIGSNASAIINGVYELLPSGQFKPMIATPESMAVVFRDGYKIESTNSQLYCDHLFTPSFLAKACQINLKTMYQPSAATTRIDALTRTATGEKFDLPPCYGDMQMLAIKTTISPVPAGPSLESHAEATGIADSKYVRRQLVFFQPTDSLVYGAELKESEVKSGFLKLK